MKKIKPITILEEFSKRVPNVEKYFIDWGRNSLFVQTTDKQSFDYKISEIIINFETIVKNKKLNFEVIR